MTARPADAAGTLPLPADALDFLADVDACMHALLDLRTGAVVEAARVSIAAGGKRLRPLLVRLAVPGSANDTASIDASADAAVSESLIRAAAAVSDVIARRRP